MLRRIRWRQGAQSGHYDFALRALVAQMYLHLRGRQRCDASKIAVIQSQRSHDELGGSQVAVQCDR
jgi:hypothetical protein